MGKYKNKMCYPRLNKSGEIISYRFMYSGKDPNTNQHKLYTKTWKVPKGLSVKAIEKERKEFEIEFIKESEKKSNGIFVSETNLTFNEFADDWLERIRLKEDAYGSYSSAKNHLRILKEWFGNYLLKNISPILVQRFYDYICSRTYEKTCVTVKQSIKELIVSDKTKCYKIAGSCGINRLTLRIATKVGSKISMETAKAICSYFKVPMDKYFSITTEKVKYSCATNRGIKTTLVMILNSARKNMLIEHNFATNEYTNGISGTVRKKEIYNEEEAREFVRLCLQEKDLRKKSIFALYIFLGLRNGEVCGLEWKDIDLENGILNIQRNTLYFKEFGVVTKEPKTKNSKRSLAMPLQLTEILKEYKLWWEEQKIMHGDLWYNADRLFLQDSGECLHPCTPSTWLKNFELRNGLKHISPHKLRHTSITMQLLAGIPIKAVSERAGHADEHITLGIYTHFLKEEDRKAANVFDRFLSV